MPQKASAPNDRQLGGRSIKFEALAGTSEPDTGWLVGSTGKIVCSSSLLDAATVRVTQVTGAAWVLSARREPAMPFVFESCNQCLHHRTVTQGVTP